MYRQEYTRIHSLTNDPIHYDMTHRGGPRYKETELGISEADKGCHWSIQTKE